MSKKGACPFIGLQESMVSLRVHLEIGTLGPNRWTVYQAMKQLHNFHKRGRRVWWITLNICAILVMGILVKPFWTQHLTMQ